MFSHDHLARAAKSSHFQDQKLKAGVLDTGGNEQVNCRVPSFQFQVHLSRPGPLVPELKRYYLLFSLKYPQKLTQKAAISGHGVQGKSFGLWRCEFCSQLNQISLHVAPPMGQIFDNVIVLRFQPSVSH